ncbi:glycine zipper 2TM domain-containing protein [Ideonella sp.]|uniref:glycine zipper 2TM domain-containing protein n=1 Tax=Ideonella sp. TaxID=1929293 RepID=UPI002B48D64D|nr:glycine zipper 2TM domain-containing protein [Ideonella sp.]HJV70460.1 glycine zipper 2TM domain-containing protein [Ideonella sp.]
MKSIVSSVIVAVAALTGVSAQAAGAAASAVEKSVHGVKLASLCEGCGVVSDMHTETRKGKASGVGAVGGAVAGGVVGHQLGGGGGKTALTVLGAVGGGLAGNEIEKNMKKHTVWVTTVTFKDGKKHKYERASDPGLKAGDVVRLDNGQPVKR